jgi:hypothetical protein
MSIYCHPLCPSVNMAPFQRSYYADARFFACTADKEEFEDYTMRPNVLHFLKQQRDLLHDVTVSN